MSNDLLPILDELSVLITESEEYHSQRFPAVVNVLAETRETLNKLRKKIHLAAKKYTIAVVGLTNVGKSTLLNALFGTDIAPKRNGPCTAVPIEFMYADICQVTVRYFQSISRTCWKCKDTSDVREKLYSLAADSGAEKSRSIECINVHVPLPILKNGLVIADTPGFGAAQTGEAEGAHEKSLEKYLGQASQVFWVVLGEQGIGKQEKNFYDSLFGKICDDIIVTGCDDWEQSDKDRFQQRFSQIFQRSPRFHFASGKVGLEAKKIGNTKNLEQAGILEIESRILALADKTRRLKGFQDAIAARLNDMVLWWNEFQSENDMRHSPLWRPGSWDRWEDKFQEMEFKQQLMYLLGAIQ
jgi:GTP-binding protein EngB required for normal cell division